MAVMSLDLSETGPRGNRVGLAGPAKVRMGAPGPEIEGFLLQCGVLDRIISHTQKY